MSLSGSIGRSLLAMTSRRGPAARLLIFTFHRVLAETDPLLPGEPSIAEFSRKASWIAEFCNVLPLPDAAQRLADGTLPSRAACITFDDGYADTETNAMPVLQALGLPASVFVAVEAIQSGIMWNDLALDAFRQGTQACDLSPFGLKPDAAGNDRRPSETAALVLAGLKYRPPLERWRLATELHRTATGGVAPRRHMLAPEALRRLARAGFDIGGHTVSHPILTSLPDADARLEITGCRDWIAEVSGSKPVTFAYPNGKPGRDYDARHVEMVRSAGFKVAVSTEWGAARRQSDPLQLPRIAPWETTRRGLATRLIRTCAGL